MTSETISMNTTEVTYSQLEMHIKDCIHLKSNLFIWGMSGIGKTAKVSAVIEEMGADMLDVFILARDSIDFGGLPYVDKNMRMAMAASQLIPLEGDNCPNLTVVVLDEFPLAAPQVQDVFYKILEEGRVGDKDIHENVRFVLMGNRAKDGGNVKRIPAPILNRCEHVTLKLDAIGWLEYYQKSGGNAAVYSFIKNNIAKLHAQFNENEYGAFVKNNAFHTPRSWTRAGEFLDYCAKVGHSEEHIKQGLSARLGVGVTEEFFLFFKSVVDYPSAMEIFAGTAKCKEDEVPHAAQYYIMSNILNTKCAFAPKDKAARLAWGKEDSYINDMNNAMTFADKYFAEEIRATMISLMCQKLDLNVNDARMPRFREYLTEGSAVTDYIYS